MSRKGRRIGLMSGVLLSIIVIYYGIIFVLGGWWPTHSFLRYSKVNTGMTKEEVISILGRPVDAYSSGDSGWMGYGYTGGLRRMDIGEWHPKATYFVIENGRVERVIASEEDESPW